MATYHSPLIKEGAHADDRLAERTKLDPAVLHSLRKNIKNMSIPKGKHHVVFEDGSAAVLKDVGTGSRRKHVVATVLGPKMRRPGLDLTGSTTKDTKRVGLNPDVRLRPHQEEALRVIGSGGRAIYAHGTGTGKTLTSIAAFEALRKKGLANKALVVAPASLLTNFREQGVKKFTDSTVSAVGGGADYQLVSLEKFRRNPTETLDKADADTIIIDEIHRSRNPQSSSFEALRTATRDKRIKNAIGLTGSLVSNHPRDIVPLADIIHGTHELGTSNRFTDAHVDTKRISGGFLKPPTMKYHLTRIPALRDKMQGMVHYVGHQDIEDMPSLDVKDVNVEMSKEQQKLYDFAMGKLDNSARERIRSGLPPTQSEAKHIFSVITKIRQASNSVGTHKKMEAAEAAEQTPKLKRALDDVEKHLADNKDGQAVLYSNLVQGGARELYHGLKARGIPTGIYSGVNKELGVTRKSRDESVSNFLQGKNRAIVLTGAGGEGISLNNATFFGAVDPHFNPEKNWQAVARARRFGGLSHRAKKDRVIDVRRYRSDPIQTWIGKKVFGREVGVDEWVQRVADEKDRLNEQIRDVSAQVKMAQKTRKSAVIIKGNPYYINKDSENNYENYYKQVAGILGDAGYKDVSYDPGEDYTTPKDADLWVGHSRGGGRLRFAPKHTKTLRLDDYEDGSEEYNKTINRAMRERGYKSIPEFPVAERPQPGKGHWTVTDRMRDALLKTANQTNYVKTAAVNRDLLLEADKDIGITGFVRPDSDANRVPFTHKGKTVGFMTPRQDPDGYHRVGAVYVKPEYRGRGVASKNISEYMQGKKSKVWVDDDNTATARAHAKAGYKKGRRAAKDAHWYIKSASLKSQEDIFNELKRRLPRGSHHVSGGLPDARGTSDVDVYLPRKRFAGLGGKFPKGTTVTERGSDYAIYTIPGYDREVNVYATNNPAKRESVDHRNTMMALAKKYPQLERKAFAIKQKGKGSEPAWAEVLKLKGNPYDVMADTEYVLGHAAKQHSTGIDKTSSRLRNILMRKFVDPVLGDVDANQVTKFGREVRDLVDLKNTNALIKGVEDNRVITRRGFLRNIAGAIIESKLPKHKDSYLENVSQVSNPFHGSRSVGGQAREIIGTAIGGPVGALVTDTGALSTGKAVLRPLDDVVQGTMQQLGDTRLANSVPIKDRIGRAIDNAQTSLEDFQDLHAAHADKGRGGLAVEYGKQQIQKHFDEQARLYGSTPSQAVLDNVIESALPLGGALTSVRKQIRKRSTDVDRLATSRADLRRSAKEEDKVLGAVGSVREKFNNWRLARAMDNAILPERVLRDKPGIHFTKMSSMRNAYLVKNAFRQYIPDETSALLNQYYQQRSGDMINYGERRYNRYRKPKKKDTYDFGQFRDRQRAGLTQRDVVNKYPQLKRRNSSTGAQSRLRALPLASKTSIA